MKPVRAERSDVPGACLGTWLFLAACQLVAAPDLDPVLVGQYPPYGQGSAQAIALSKDYAYVAFRGAGLHILDIREPAGPQRVGAYDVPGDIVDVAVQGHYAYVRLENVPGFQVIDVSDPTRPRMVGAHRTQGDYPSVTGLVQFVEWKLPYCRGRSGKMNQTMGVKLNAKVHYNDNEISKPLRVNLLLRSDPDPPDPHFRGFIVGLHQGCVETT